MCFRISARLSIVYILSIIKEIEGIVPRSGQDCHHKRSPFVFLYYSNFLFETHTDIHVAHKLVRTVNQSTEMQSTMEI